MKYEAVFGDQSLFDGCYDENAFIVIATSDGRKFVVGEFTEYGIVEGNVKSDGLRIAMRRIITEPKRWTWEDQKAGRDPKVGCMVMATSVDECASVAAINNDAVCVVFHDGEFTTLHKSEISPIETPEEKAQRLRDEWCNKALSSASILSGMQEYELKRLGGYIGDIYDALLSGELTMPSKDGE